MLKNAVVLMSHGVTFAAMVAVSQQCTDEPPCVQEYMAAAGLIPPPADAVGLVPPPSGRASHQLLLHRGQGESLMPPYTRGSVSLSLSSPFSLTETARVIPT